MRDCLFATWYLVSHLYTMYRVCSSLNMWLVCFYTIIQEAEKMTSGSWTDPSTTSLGEEKKKTLESKTHDTLKSIYNIFDQTICEESFKNSALTEKESRIAYICCWLPVKSRRMHSLLANSSFTKHTIVTQFMFYKPVRERSMLSFPSKQTESLKLLLNTGAEFPSNDLAFPNMLHWHYSVRNPSTVFFTLP